MTTHDDGDEQPACPHCDTLSLTKRAPKPGGSEPATDSEYYCRNCASHVDDPVWRTRNHPRTPLPKGTVARALEDADPDDLRCDGSGHADYIAECQQCGVIEDGDLETVGDAIEDHDQFHDVQIQRAVTDGSGDIATWRLECMDCDYTEDVDVQDPSETPPRKVDREVTRHKNSHDQSHVVRVHKRPGQRDIDPSLLTDGGRAQMRTQQRQVEQLQMQHAAEQARAQRQQMVLEAGREEKQGQRIWIIPEFEPEDAESDYIRHSIRQALPEYDCQLAVDHTAPMTKDRIYQMLAGGEIDNKARTDGGQDDDGPFYVVNERDAHVIAGPYDTSDEASSEAQRRDGVLMIATEIVLDLIEVTSTASLTWSDDADQPTPDGGRSTEQVLEDGYDEWCDWCQSEFQNGPTWKVDGDHITGYFCRRACAERWRNASQEVERIDQPNVRTDGGQRTSACGGGASNPSVDTASVLSIVDDNGKLYYASGNSSTGTDRALHVDEDCQRLDRAKNTRSCSVDRRPRGHLCSKCAPGTTLSAIDAALEAAGGDDA